MKLLWALIGVLAIIATAAAVPTTGAATDITSNGFNLTATGVTGTDCWIMWGDFSGGENWASPNQTASGGTANIQVLGTPIFGGEKIWYQVCDSTGCGNERQVTIAAVTPNPETTWGQGIMNITHSRFNPMTMAQEAKNGFTQVAPFAIVVGFALLMYGTGIWFRTKSVKMAAILVCMLAPFVLSSGSGLYLGVMFNGIFMVEMIFALMLAGILFFLARN